VVDSKSAVALQWRLARKTEENVRRIEKRREARYPCNDPAEARILPGDGSLLPATVVDISRSGLRLEIPVSVVPGSQIEVSLPKQVVIFGEVRHCRRTGDRFSAGVQIKEVLRSSQTIEHIQEDHLYLYLVGKGLTLPQVMSVKEHLPQCEVCRLRLVDMYTRRLKPRSSVPANN